MIEPRKIDAERSTGFLDRLEQAIVNGGGVNAVSRRMNRNKNTLTRWKSGQNKISLTDLRLLAAATGVNEVWLAFGDEATNIVSDESLTIDALRKAFDLFIPVALRMSEVPDHESLFNDVVHFARSLEFRDESVDKE